MMRKIAIAMLISFTFVWQGLWFVTRVVQRQPTSVTDTYLILSAIWCAALMVFWALDRKWE